MRRRILAVIVLFKINLEDSVSYQSLMRAASGIAPEALDLHVVLQDNSPDSVAPAILSPQVRCFADRGNSGLATAYNRALQIAHDEHYDWLLTLDQDTQLPPDTFAHLLEAIDVAEEQPEIGAIVPRIRADGRVVSPHYFAGNAWPRFFSSGFTGVPSETVFAFNSGSLLRVAALRQIDGYDPEFWLDASDLSLYRRLGWYGKRVYIAGSLELQHNFSMLQMRERVSPGRYRALLLAESAFWDLYMSLWAGLERTFRLLVRLGKHLVRRDPAELRELTVQQLGRRVFRSRRYRLALWRRETADRLGVTPQRDPVAGRPKVSVCMAAYNGERHIEAQLRTILPQLGPGDEVVIVEDVSRDKTFEILREVQEQAASDPASPRVQLVQHRENRGVIRTFEEAVRSATGDILFLADDDDLWAPDKVRKVLEIFAEQPGTRVVCTGLAMIDEAGEPLQDQQYLRHRRFTTGLLRNFLHNQYQGSTMAFRSSLLRCILPFPTDRLFLHDAWIGARNTLTGGGTAYLDEPLLLYRRHTGNYSRRFGRWKQLMLRLQFASALLRRALFS